MTEIIIERRIIHPSLFSDQTMDYCMKCKRQTVHIIIGRQLKCNRCGNIKY